MKLEKEISRLEECLIHEGKENTSVSANGINWHIDHSLRVIIGISKALKNSDPAEYKWKFNAKRLFVFFKNEIPRGVGKAPARVVSTEEITRESLEKLFALAKFSFLEAQTLPAKSNFMHPIFGCLNLKKSIHFMKIHTTHHQKIIDEIIGK